MRFFKHIDNEKDIFYKLPGEFNLSSDKKTLSHSLGATLYMNGLRSNLLRDLTKTTSTSVVICLEDSISTDKVEIAEKNVMNLFGQLEVLYKEKPEGISNLPLVFLRVRSIEQFNRFLNNSALVGLCGFVFPKFDTLTGIQYLSLLEAYNTNNSKSIYGMPIIETKASITLDTRIKELLAIRDGILPYRDLILNVRLGGTDFSGIYGLRRDKYHTIYDLSVINSCLSDIINVFKIEDYIISAPVNEFFSFDNPVENYGIYREILLDRANGLTGKTVIHPNQVDLVNALMVISKEEYLDAKAILASSEDGVIRSIYNNKMNEVKTHTKWARDIIELSRIIGVYNNGKDYRDILAQASYCPFKEPFENIIKY